MKVIMTADVKNIGKKGEVVNVKEGYYNNFLFPNKFAILASEQHMKNLEATIKNAQLRDQKEKSKVEEISKSLRDFNFVMKAKSGPSGKLFGTVTAIDISKLIKDLTKLEIDKRKIVLPEGGIKATGSHQVTLKLHTEVETNITVNIEAQ
ncbi:MAG: 50S ribosomal protein L9 [Candidatus Wallbacteria bacterium]